MKTRNRLKNLSVTRIALCAKGMNQEAVAVLAKAADDASEGSGSCPACGSETATIGKCDTCGSTDTMDATMNTNRISVLTKALRDALESIEKDEDLTDEQRAEAVEQANADFSAEMAKAKKKKPAAAADDAEDAADGADDEEAEGEMAKAQDALAGLTEAQRASIAPLLKSSPSDAVATAIAKAEARMEKLEKENRALVEKEADRALTSHAERLAKGAPISVDEVKRMLKRAAGDKDAVKDVENVVKRLRAATEAGVVLDEIGKEADVEVTSGVRADLAKAADAVQKASPKLTRQQAIAKALTDDASLYERWEQESASSE